jgi:uncharacterized protein YjbI with pentapeptide repeats
MNRITLGDPLLLARYYVEPDCQEINPADRPERDFLVSREPIFKKIAEFFRTEPFQKGANQLFVLSDAGMGKTALLTMLKLLHMNKLWPSQASCHIFKLDPQTQAHIREIESRRNAILLLDALDEDPLSYSRVGERVVELLDETSDFHKVIITCRTQFFPVVRTDPLERPGQVVIAGYTCPTKYLSTFDDGKVDSYLKKRFAPRFGILRRQQLIEKAKRVVASMGSLRCRPMLLAHIQDLMRSPRLSEDPREFNIYKALVQAWLNRQEAKSKIQAKALWEACELLANQMQARGTRVISAAELATVKESTPIMSSLDAMDLEGRSLLNRNSDGDYVFSHYSIQEFLVAHGLLYGGSEKLEPVKATSFMAQMVLQEFLGNESLQGARLDLLDMSQADLRRINLRNRDLRGLRLTRQVFDESDLSGANLTGANLGHCSFAGADLSNAVLDGAVLDDTNLKGANFAEASLKEVRASMSDFSRGNFYMCDFSSARFTRCDFTAARPLGWTRLTRTVFVNCDFSESDWSGPNYRRDPDWASYPGIEVMQFGKKGLHSDIKSIGNVCGGNFRESSNLCAHFRQWLREKGASM